MSLAVNRKANFEYFILDEYDAGIVLLGSEVKSIRQGNVTMVDSFIYLKDGEVWLKNLKVARYSQTHSAEPHDENRDKKLLLTKNQIQKIEKSLRDKGITCIPLKIFTKSNRIKVKIGLAKGKKLWNKKEDIKRKDIEREIKRNLNINI